MLKLDICHVYYLSMLKLSFSDVSNYLLSAYWMPGIVSGGGGEGGFQYIGTYKTSNNTDVYSLYSNEGIPIYAGWR